MAKLKIRKGDTVEVLHGKERDRGKRGTVLEVLADEGRAHRRGPQPRRRSTSARGRSRARAARR